MSNVKIDKSSLCGEIFAPPSKSAAHRAIIAAALSDGESVISNVAFSEDIKATIQCMKTLGAEIKTDGSVLKIKGITAVNMGKLTLDCHESGSTLRFLIPIAAALGANAEFIGRGKLPERPIGAYLELLPKHGVSCKSGGGLPLNINGKLCGGEFPIVGNISSQYITGLLMALPLLDEDSIIRLTSPLSSVGYVDMTLNIMRSFGIVIEVDSNCYIIRGSQRYKPCSMRIEGDWSQAAFWSVAGVLNGNITIKGMDFDSLQGDKQIIDIAKHFGADIAVRGNDLICRKSALKAYDFDASNIPDIVPIIAVMAAFAEGNTVISGTHRLKIKESDRAGAVCNGLKSLGVNCICKDDSIEITGGSVNMPAEICGYNDHRIVMSFAVLGSVVGDITITDRESINKSYPNFFEDFVRLGGKINVV